MKRQWLCAFFTNKRLRYSLTALSLLFAAFAYELGDIGLRTGAFVFKVLASAGFVCVAFSGKPDNRLAALALFCGALGDVFTEVFVFFPQAVTPLFALGVLLFLTEHLLLIRFVRRHLAFGLGQGLSELLLFIPLSLLAWSRVRLGIPEKILGLGYAGVLLYLIVVSGGFTLASGSLPAGLLCLGSILIFISDAALALNHFTPLHAHWLGFLNYAAYYPGQICIALALGMNFPNVGK